MYEKYQKYKARYLEYKGGAYTREPLYGRDTIVHNLKTHYQVCNIKKAVYPPVKRIIAIGDLHGDFNAMLSALQLGKVIDEDGNWIGGDTYVVQVGDILDCNRGGQNVCGTGAEELQILDFLFKLDKLANKSGGKIINILGNHELMNVVGNFSYASPQHIDAMGGVEKRINLFKPGGEVARMMACNMQPIVKIGKYIFVHGAILPQHIDKIRGVDANQKLQHLTNLVKQMLTGEIPIEQFTREYPEEYSIIGPKGDMFWNRTLSNPKTSEEKANACYNSKLLLKKLGAEGGAIVMGHTPQKEITPDCDASIWKVDVAMSEGFSRNGKERGGIQVLEILDNGGRVNILRSGSKL